MKSSACRYLRTVTMNWTDKLKLVIPLLRNKFVLTGLIVIVWMLFFDQNNLIDKFSLAARIKDLEKQ